MHEAPNHEAIALLFASTVLILLMILTIVFIVLYQQKRKLLHRQQLKQVESQFEKTLLQSELKIQEEIFRAISQNLHDNIGSNISTAMLLLYKDYQTTPAEEEANRQDALKTLGTVVDDLKDISRSLNPGYLEEIGLTTAVRLRMEQIERSKRYKVCFNVNDHPATLDRQKQLILFYIFQEAISNIHKHSGAKEISVSLQYAPNKLTMQVKDNGTGIGVEGRPIRKGSGMINMKNNAAIINAALHIRSDEKGTTIEVDVPEPYALTQTSG
jgi:two-component system NarL family sensor kinase